MSESVGPYRGGGGGERCLGLPPLFLNGVVSAYKTGITSSQGCACVGQGICDSKLIILLSLHHSVFIYLIYLCIYSYLYRYRYIYRSNYLFINLYLLSIYPSIYLARVGVVAYAVFVPIVCSTMAPVTSLFVLPGCPLCGIIQTANVPLRNKVII